MCGWRIAWSTGSWRTGNTGNAGTCRCHPGTTLERPRPGRPSHAPAIVYYPTFTANPPRPLHTEQDSLRCTQYGWMAKREGAGRHLAAYARALEPVPVLALALALTRGRVLEAPLLGNLGTFSPRPCAASGGVVEAQHRTSRAVPQHTLVLARAPGLPPGQSGPASPTQPSCSTHRSGRSFFSFLGPRRHRVPQRYRALLPRTTNRNGRSNRELQPSRRLSDPKLWTPRTTSKHQPYLLATY